MRIVLDLQAAQGASRFRGIGRYALSISQAIVRLRGEHEVLLLLNDYYPEAVESIRCTFDDTVSQDRIRVWQAPGPVRSSDAANEWRRATARRIREAYLADLNPDIVHISDMFGGYVDDVVASIGTPGSTHLTTIAIYDLIPLLRPSDYLTADRRYARHYREAVADAKHADGWLAISESSAREARIHLGADQDRVVNISAASDPQFVRISVPHEIEDRLRARLGLPRPFVMYTGGSEPTKNLKRLIEAYGRLPMELRRGRQLVIAGEMAPRHLSELWAEARAAGLGEEDLLFTGYVTDDDLVYLYNLCELFVAPSTHEGFGLPALEAMTCGAAVIGANATSLPEVIGWSEALFDPFDVSAMSAKMGQGLTDTNFRAELIRRGTEQAQRFSWDTSAREALAAFERLVSARKSATSQDVGSSHGHAVSRLIREIRAIPGRPTEPDLLGAARAIAQNHPQKREGRVLVDLSAIVHGDLRSGIQRVVRSILASLPAHLGDLHLEAVYATRSRAGYRRVQQVGSGDGNLHLEPTEEVISPRVGDVFLGLDLEPYVIADQAATYSQFRRLGIPTYFVVYDLLPVLLPERFPKDSKSAHERWLEVVSAADGALCISRAVAGELRAWVDANGASRCRPFQIAWFHLGADIEQSRPTTGLPPDRSDVLRELASRATFAIVGTIEPRKGHEQALDAFEVLWGSQSDINLVIVGKRGWHVDSLIERLSDHPQLGKRLFWMEGVSDEYLEEIYRVSSCLIVPSEGEGFGLPLIEAARHGIPIIARALDVFREVAGDHAVYFDGKDPQCLADAVREWLSLRSHGLEPQSHEMRWQTWDQSAAQVAAFLRGRGQAIE